MKRRAILTSLAAASDTSMAAAPPSKPLLTISGRIGCANNKTNNTYDFSEAEFLNLPQSSIKTATPWTPTAVFVGPLLLVVMRAACVTSGTLNMAALDGYSTPIPWDDLVKYGVILALSQDGQRLRSNRWGPLWTIYPRDQHAQALTGPVAESRFIWQVNKIEVSA